MSISTYNRDPARVHLLEESRNAPDFDRFDSIDLQIAFNYLDLKCFDCEIQELLRKSGLGIEFGMSPRLTSLAGRFMWRPGKPYRIELSSRLLANCFRNEFPYSQNVEAKGIKCRDRLDAFLLILEHEIVHAW